MPSTFDELYAEVAVPHVLGHFGETITYTPAGGTAVPLTGSVGPERTVEDDDGGYRRLIRTRSITISRDAGSSEGGVAAPAKNDSVTVGGVVYAVMEIGHESPSVSVLECVRREDVQRSSDEYRRRRGR